MKLRNTLLKLLRSIQFFFHNTHLHKLFGGDTSYLINSIPLLSLLLFKNKHSDVDMSAPYKIWQELVHLLPHWDTLNMLAAPTPEHAKLLSPSQVCTGLHLLTKSDNKPRRSKLLISPFQIWKTQSAEKWITCSRSADVKC